MVHQPCDTICRTGAEKVCKLVSKITSLLPILCIRPRLLLLAEITVRFGDSAGSMLYTNENQLLFSKPEVHRGERLDGGM